MGRPRKNLIDPDGVLPEGAQSPEPETPEGVDPDGVLPEGAGEDSGLGDDEQTPAAIVAGAADLPLFDDQPLITVRMQLPAALGNGTRKRGFILGQLASDGTQYPADGVTPQELATALNNPHLIAFE